MPNPYKVYQKNQGPQWLKSLDKYIEKSPNDEYRDRDAKATVRNHGGEQDLVSKATYVEKGRK